MSELSYKQKIMKNPPRAHSSCQSNPKGIKPQQRLKEYPKATFIVSSGAFCHGCREDLPVKKSSALYHIKSTKHNDGKKRPEQLKVKDQDIPQSLKSTMKKYMQEVRHFQSNNKSFMLKKRKYK